MKRRAKRVGLWLAMLLGGATVFQTVGFSASDGAINAGCRGFALNGVMSDVDMCYLLDCESGFFGGLVDPCDPQNPSLLDCGTSSNTSSGTSGTTTTP